MFGRHKTLKMMEDEMRSTAYDRTKMEKLMFKRQRALEELVSAAAEVVHSTKLRSWALKNEPTGQVWARVQMMQEALKEYDKYA